MPKRPEPASKTAFTLVELLVVLAIIGVLATLGLSVATAAMQKSKATKCLSSLRQISVAVRVYVGDHDGRLPDTGHARAEDGTSLSWLNTLGTYLGPKFIGRCPANTTSQMAVTYGWNDLLTETNGDGIPASRCQAQSATLAVGEISDTYNSEHFHFAGSRSGVTFNQFKSAVGVERHVGAANYLFVDGHVESLAPSEVKTRLAAADSHFLQP